MVENWTVKRWLAGLLLAMLVGGCAYEAPPAASGGEQAARYQSTALAAEATAGAARTEAQRQAAQATQQAAEVTAQAYTRQVEATSQAQATAVTFGIEATRQAMMIEATQTAFEQSIQATAEQRTFEATATAAEWDRLATATAQGMAYEATATRQAWEGMRTATAESVGATAAAYQATSTRAAEIRDMRLAGARDYGVPILLLLLLGGLVVLIVWVVQQWSQRPVIIERSFLGDAQPMAVKLADGGYSFVDLDRQPGPVLKVLPSGEVEAPQLRSAGQEERTTARDQLVDAVARPKLGAGHRAMPELPMAEPPTAPVPGLTSVRVLRQLEQAGRAGFVNRHLLEALAADWEEEE